MRRVRVRAQQRITATGRANYYPTYDALATNRDAQLRRWSPPPAFRGLATPSSISVSPSGLSALAPSSPPAPHALSRRPDFPSSARTAPFGPPSPPPRRPSRGPSVAAQLARLSLPCHAMPWARLACFAMPRVLPLPLPSSSSCFVSPPYPRDQFFSLPLLYATYRPFLTLPPPNPCLTPSPDRHRRRRRRRPHPFVPRSLPSRQTARLSLSLPPSFSYPSAPLSNETPPLIPRSTLQPSTWTRSRHRYRTLVVVPCDGDVAGSKTTGGTFHRRPKVSPKARDLWSVSFVCQNTRATSRRASPRFRSECSEGRGRGAGRGGTGRGPVFVGIYERRDFFARRTGSFNFPASRRSSLRGSPFFQPSLPCHRFFTVYRALQQAWSELRPSVERKSES